MEESVGGLLHDRTCPPDIPLTPPEKWSRIVRLTLAPPPHDATHWTTVS